jgi:hypothetical protein
VAVAGGASRAVVVLFLLCLLLEVAAEVQTLCHSVISFSRQLFQRVTPVERVHSHLFRTIWEFAGVREHIMCGMSAGGAELSSLVSKADTVQATAERQELMDPQTFHSRHTCSSSKQLGLCSWRSARSSEWPAISGANPTIFFGCSAL